MFLFSLKNYNILIFQAKYRSIKFINQILNDLKIGSHTEDDIIAKMGSEPIVRDYYENQVCLIYSYSDGKSYYVITFILERQSSGLVLVQKKIENINVMKKDIQEQSKKLKIISQNLMQETQNTENNIKENNIEVLNNYKKKTSQTFGDIILSNQDFEAINIINDQIMLKNLTNKQIQERINLYFISKLLIGNENQEKTVLKQVKQKFLAKYKIKNKDLEQITDNAIMIMYGIDIFFYQQRALFNKQFGLNIFSKFKKYNESRALNDQNSSIVCSYELKDKNGQISIFKNQKQYQIPMILMPFLNNKKINYWIELPDNEYVKFTHLEKLFKPDINYEIQIITVPIENANEVKSVCEFKLVNKQILPELKKLPGVDYHTRTISINTTKSDEIDILNAIEYYKGKYVFEQEDKVIVLLHIDTIEKNYKLQKSDIQEENKNEMFIFLTLIVNKFGTSLKKT